MKTPLFLAALGISAGFATASQAETIHSTDVYLKYNILDASQFAAAGGRLEVYGAPQNGATPEEVAAAIRLPAYLAQRDVTAVEPGQGGYRVALVFAPKAGLSGESVCRGEAKGGQAGSATKVLVAFCRSETTILSETRLEASGGFVPTSGGFQAGMNRAMKEILPRRSPFDEGDRVRRRGG